MNATLPNLIEREIGRPLLASYRANLDRTLREARAESVWPFIDPDDYQQILKDLATSGDLDRSQQQLAAHWQRPGLGATMACLSDHLTAITLAYWKLHRAERRVFTPTH